MALDVNAQDITTTASELGTSRGRRTALMIRNPTGSGDTIYVGDAAVDGTTAVFVLAAGDPTLSITIGANGDPLAAEAWYAVAASGTATGVVVGEV